MQITNNLAKKYKFILAIIITFIISYSLVSYLPKTESNSEQELKQILVKQNDSSQFKIAQALFTPQDNIENTIINLINSEKKSIKIAIYYLTNYKIAQALIKAKLINNINITIITDPSHVSQSNNTQVWSLEENDIPIFTYNNKLKKNKRSALMHNKFMIFEKNIYNIPLVITGSFNYTHSAQKHNQENIVILSNKHIINKFNQQFNYLKTNSKTLDNFFRKNVIGKEQPLFHN